MTFKMHGTRFFSVNFFRASAKAIQLFIASGLEAALKE